MAEPVIRVRGVAVGYPPVVLMENLDFDVERGSVFAILGGSGCGKSTLLKNMIGLYRPLKGSIELVGLGTPRQAMGGGKRPPGFGVLYQSGALFGSMTLIENVSLPLQEWTNLDDEAVESVARSKLALVGLSGFENHLPAEISGGMKKRAGIARALALDPPILFLDEPSAGLDPVSAVELDDLIELLSETLGVTSVLVTHELMSIERIVTDCIMLDKRARAIIARGDPRVLCEESENPIVHAFFHREPEPVLL
ncbi:MAG: ABC transporter ATP-binding protein [Planctomycetota bacterium]